MNDLVPDESMKSTAMDLFVEASMLLKSGKSVVVYVEGDSDRRLYQSMFNDKVACLPSYTYQNVEKIIAYNDEKSDQYEMPLILGVVDRDYRIAAQEVPSNANLICTELRDIECEIINSDAFSNLVEEYGTAKLRNCWPNVDDFRDVLSEFSAQIGRIRFYNHIKKSGIDFKHIDYQKIIDVKKHSYMESKVIPHLSGAQKPGIVMPKKIDDVLKLCSDKKYARHLKHPLRLSRGHDFFALLAFYFNKGYGRSSAEVSAEILESAIRIGFKPMSKNSPTVGKIINWFAANNLLNLVR